MIYYEKKVKEKTHHDKGVMCLSPKMSQRLRETGHYGFFFFFLMSPHTLLISFLYSFIF